METLPIVGLITLAVLFYFINRLVVSIQSSLAKLELVLADIDIKLKKLNSFFNSIENVSRAF